MSRVINSGATLSINMGPVERALVGYYSRRFGGSKGAIIRGLIRKVAQSDADFSPQLFEQYVRLEFAKTEGVSEDEAGMVHIAVEHFLETMKREG